MIMNNILETIKKSSRIAISYHYSPDGDSLGSALALKQGLSQLDKVIEIISLDDIPKMYSFLPGSDSILKHFEDDKWDLVIALDCGDLKRLSVPIRKNAGYRIINIDHHRTNELYGDLNFVDTNAAAVGEIVYQIIRLLGINITKEIATCLYTSIITDSGSFRFSNTTSVTHSIAGDLINTGIDFSNIHRLIYDNKPFERLKLYSMVLNTAQLHYNGRVCVMKLTKNMPLECNCEISDTSDLVNFGLSVDTVEVTALLKEMEDGVKVSLRSKTVVDVRRVAENYNGGGHIRAAGFSCEDTLEAVEQKLLHDLSREFSL